MKNRYKKNCARVLNAAKKLTRVDPTRTSTMRRAFEVLLSKQFALLKGRIVKAFVEQDLFGFTPVANVADSPFTMDWEMRRNLLRNSNPQGINQYTVGQSVKVKGKSGYTVTHSDPYGDKNFVQVSSRSGKRSEVHKSFLSDSAPALGGPTAVSRLSKSTVLDAVPRTRVGDELSLKTLHERLGGSVEDLHQHLTDLHDEEKVKLVPVTRHESGLLGTEHTVKRHREEFGYVRKLTDNSNPNHDELGRFSSLEGSTPSVEDWHKAHQEVLDRMGDHEDEGTDHGKEYAGLYVMALALGSKPSKLDSIVLVHKNGKLAAAGNISYSHDGTKANIEYIGSVVKGGGSKVMEHLLKQAKGKGVQEVTADASPDAIPLNKKFGFVMDGKSGPNGQPMKMTLNLTSNDTSSQKLEAFQEWLKTQVSSLLTGQSQEQLWKAFIDQGWKKGAGRAFDDVNRAKPKFTQEQQQFYAGSREQFLSTSFNQPVAVEKVQLLVSRTFDEMQNVTSDMSNRMSRVLADGMVQGKSPHDVARDLTQTVDFSKHRAEVVARTELIRAHAEGQLTAMEQLGVGEVGVQVEWLATDDDATCPLCSDLEGTVLTVEDARGMLPRHPNCRCCWVPNLEGS